MPGYAFGPFRLMPARRTLVRHDTPVALTPKAFDTLVALVERRDRVVSREELLDLLWPGMAVEEANLTQQVFLLRKALDDSSGGEQYIATVPRRGYRFVKDVAVLHSPAGEPIVRPAAPRGWRRVARSPRIALTVGVLACAAAAMWLWWPGSPSSSSDLEYRLAVLPFSYRGSAEHASLGESMVDLLSRTLDGAGRLQTIEPRGVLGVLAQHRDVRSSPDGVPGGDPDEARAVARRLGAGRYVVGDIVEAGGRVRISARLYRVAAPADPIGATVEGQATDLFALNDRLTAQLAVGETPRAGEGLPTTAMRTSANLDALKAFLRGELLFRARPSTQVRRRDAYIEYSRAVDLDPAFALAWFRRSQLAYFSGQGLAEVTPSAESAYRHRENLPWRQRRLVEAHRAFAAGASRDSQAAYREILKAHPDDVEALFGLALLGAEYGWLLGEAFNSYRRELDAFLTYQPDDFMGLWLLRNLEAQERRCAEVEPLNDRTFPNAAPHRAVAVFCGPSAPRQDDFVRDARHWPTGTLRQARLWVNAMAQNPRGGLALGRLIDEREESTAVDLLFLAELELALGRRAAARDAFVRLASVYPPWSLEDGVYRMLAPHLPVRAAQLHDWRTSLERWDAAAEPNLTSLPRARGPRHDGLHAHVRLYLLGRLDVRLGDYAAALGRADDVERLAAPPGSGSLSLDLAQALRAHVLEAQGRLADALRALESAPREVPFSHRTEWIFTQPQERYLRAEILNRLGRTAEALRWYQSIHYWPESVLAGPAHLRQAEMHERLGQRRQAADHYRRFIELWRDCDGELRHLIEGAERALRRVAG
jgi:DNA-binding winged helix-turn-helix (wHTH) protein/tetratricopeptide (TPR) repeat protein/TolB-like protein